MRNLLHQIQYEYSQGGLKHIVVGSIEKLFIEMLRQSPPIYWKTAPRYFRWRSSNDVLKYQCPPDPFKIEYVDPDDIRRRTGRPWPEHLNRRILFGKVRDGDWDKEGKLIEDSEFYHAAEKHFIDGVRWEEIDSIRQKLEGIECGSHDDYKYKDRDDLLAIYRRLDEVYDRIRQEGYLSQGELLEEPGDMNDGLFLDTLDEVTVDVGRNGELLHVDGIHRLTVAKLLDLNEIPVVFLIRHKEWTEYREKLCEGDEPIPDHPDLRDLK